MFHQMSRFVSRFRDLEQQEFSHSIEEERQWKVLKEKLASPQIVEQQESYQRKCIVVMSLYAQAGASFLASNLAYAWSGKGIPVTLSELPKVTSYYYFALDFERRARKTSLLLMQNNHLRIQIESPAQIQHESSQTDTANWLLRICKDSPIVVIDVSSYWNDIHSKQIFEHADEIWVVFDADLARLTRLFLLEPVPAWWRTERRKIKMIANKWNSQLSRTSIMKKVEGTLSLWDQQPVAARVTNMIPLMDGEKTAMASAKANLLLELFPEEESEFQSLIHAYKGRML
ncbi:hypothetical protein [Brevibacillus sp. MER 51]|uniref:hypothetical protein n=1 Tax=Brevibacillus sp. MER 51 TaxID=2939560 RepID=UPI00203B9E8B|nr:hypothetical protein [Brevibacillus sp. MER 51]MCM3146443.1 hypothetical protein [Brevibacillus sp. MER 51]